MFLEAKYIQLLSSSLNKFVRKDTRVWNFDCPHCNDTRKRGYLLFKRGQFYSYCHNCNLSQPFKLFLESVSPLLFNDYIVEKYSGDPNPNKRTVSIPDLNQNTRENEILLKLQKVSLLDPDHIAKTYVVGRQIPSFWHSRLFFAPNFNKFANELVDDDDKFDPKFAEPRLVIPMFDKFKRLIGVQGRALTQVKDKLRYITAIVAPDNPRFFGLDLVKMERKYYVLEGPIDSMFLNNAIAVCGGAIHSELRKHNFVKPTAVVVYDNEPRNKDVVRNMKKVARRGYQICVWPDNTKFKDINQMVLDKVPASETVLTERVQTASEYIKHIIDNNTFQGLEAERRIIEWSKI